MGASFVFVYLLLFYYDAFENVKAGIFEARSLTVLHVHCGALARMLMMLIHLLITADVTVCFLHLDFLIFSPVCVCRGGGGVQGEGGVRGQAGVLDKFQTVEHV